jgi:hypothetical protein
MSRVCGVSIAHTLLTRKHLAIELVVPRADGCYRRRAHGVAGGTSLKEHSRWPSGRSAVATGVASSVLTVVR